MSHVCITCPGFHSLCMFAAKNIQAGSADGVEAEKRVRGKKGRGCNKTINNNLA